MYVIYSRHHEEHRPPYQVHFGRVAPASQVSGRVSAILVLEGGYCLPALGELAVTFLRGWTAGAG